MWGHCRTQQADPFNGNITFSWLFCRRYYCWRVNTCTVAAMALLPVPKYSYGIVTSTKVLRYTIATWDVIVVYISNTWSCCKYMSDHAAAVWSPELLPVFIVLLDHAATAWSCSIMLQLHGFPFAYKAWWVVCGYSLDQLCWFGPRIHAHQWHSAGNNCHWLADPKATMCEPKCKYLGVIP